MGRFTVTDVYSHILDDDRKNNAQLFQEAFYDHKPSKKPEQELNLPDGLTPETLSAMLADPEMSALLSMLANKLNKK